MYKQVDRGPLINTVYKRQLGWLGHVLRRDAQEPTTILALYEPSIRHGTVKRGRPKLSYSAQIASLLTSKTNKLTVDEIKNLAQDRSEWNKRIKGQDKPPNQ